MENLIREYLMSQPEVGNVEFRHDAPHIKKGKYSIFEGCSIVIYRNPTYVPSKNLFETVNSMFNLRLDEDGTKWRIVML
jgi:hypothetical protein